MALQSNPTPLSPDAVMRRLAETEALMAERLRIRGRTLDDKLRRARRLMPRRVAREAAYLAEAQHLCGAPKLARRIDPARLDAAHRVVTDYLRSVDPKERRKDRILGILGVVAVNILLIGGALIYYLWYRGLV